MSEYELKDYIKKNPNSDIAAAYRLGRKDMNIELSKTIERFQYLKGASVVH